MTKEAHVFVRFGVPWVATRCPDCNDRVDPEDRFCSHCGLALSFDIYRAVLKGTLKPKRTPGWTEVVPDTEAARKALEQALVDLENKYCMSGRNESILRIMREQYIKCIPVHRKRKSLDCTVENYNYHTPYGDNRYVHTFPAAAKIKCKESY